MRIVRSRANKVSASSSLVLETPITLTCAGRSRANAGPYDETTVSPFPASGVAGRTTAELLYPSSAASAGCVGPAPPRKVQLVARDGKRSVMDDRTK